MTTCPIPGFEGFCEPEGLGTNSVLILGEAMGEAEASEGLPFRPAAPAGSVLERAIKRSGFNRAQFVVFNVVPSRPPNNYLEGAPYEAEAIAWGRSFVEECIAQFRPSCILALGNVALKATVGLTGIMENRGYPCRSTLGIPVIASLHPAFLRRGAMSYLSVLMHDLKFAVAFAGALRQSAGETHADTVMAERTLQTGLEGSLSADSPRAWSEMREVREDAARTTTIACVPSPAVSSLQSTTRTSYPAHPDLSDLALDPEQPHSFVRSVSRRSREADPIRTIRVSFWSPVLWREVAYEIPQPLPSLFDPIAPPGYVCYPSETDALEFEQQVADHPDVMLAYDIETPYVKGEENDPESTAIRSVQFSLSSETGIFLPWRSPFDAIVRRILALRNPKIGANNWRFDDPILEANGCILGGQRYDLRWMWKHFQPDLSGGLSFINSFFNPGLGVWKHWSTNDPVYGIRDCDVLQRIL